LSPCCSIFLSLASAPLASACSTWRANAGSDRRQSLKVVWSTPAAAQHILKGAPRSIDSTNCATSFFVFFVGRPGRFSPLRVGRRCFEAYAVCRHVSKVYSKQRQREIWKSSSRGALQIGEAGVRSSAVLGNGGVDTRALELGVKLTLDIGLMFIYEESGHLSRYLSTRSRSRWLKVGFTVFSIMLLD